MIILNKESFCQVYIEYSLSDTSPFLKQKLDVSGSGLITRLYFRDVWIQQEKELLQEVAGMGELREPWHSRQVELLDRHLHLLRLYSQAKENLQAHKGSLFKPSSRKSDRSLEFAPINLHLQRMWVHNDTLNKSGFYDWVTVGAFTAHSHRSKNGGLIK